jgi:hypothetical protein
MAGQSRKLLSTLSAQHDPLQTASALLRVAGVDHFPTEKAQTGDIEFAAPLRLFNVLDLQPDNTMD